MEDEAAKEDFEALDDIEDIEATGEGDAEVVMRQYQQQGVKPKVLILFLIFHLLLRLNWVEVKC